ncbi:GNAT family N-acetyltransferase [Flavobacterium capsici]|uniref:GNAT family N-acetyltransferase n=1 Tax=Flavobacterium capsici TaxID=3075618 RepID=A0AA96J2M8_9FLAO|nr:MULTISPECIES: GNAT family N-acetyltransferase [unclassified Flavobacterium]WNM19632.1 GNAT family N-acetyltransferase [Flavobacterium sp. PMR2A8]WNM21021.1 GNAT family N-acetyltransferase [Flavobacterium sp. PMTSA4]
MSIEWIIKRFEALSTQELYQLLKLRSEVFVVEQNCVYLDIDDKDQKALHLFGLTDGKMVAYARLFKPKDYFENASIGRVVTHPDFRAKKIGHELMQQAVNAIEEYFGEKQITISAQLYLKKFYERHGFTQTSEMYLEDDIPHIEMKRH